MPKKYFANHLTKKTILLMLILSLVIGPLTHVNLVFAAIQGYGKINIDKADFSIDVGESKLFSLPRGWALEILESLEESGHAYYKVKTINPNKVENDYLGYVLSSAVETIPEEAFLATLETQRNLPDSNLNNPSIETTSTNSTNLPYSEGAVGIVKIIKSNSNLRDTADGKTILSLEKNTLLPYMAKPVFLNGYNWYYVITEQGRKGYLREDVIEVISGNLPESPPANPVPLAIATPSSEVSGTLTVTKSNSNLRQEPGGKTLTQFKKGTVLSYYGTPINQGSYDWYYVKDASGYSGYLRSDVITINAAPSDTSEEDDTSKEPGGEEGGSAENIGDTGTYVRVVLPKSNLRQEPGGRVLVQLDKGTILPLLKAPFHSKGYTWYYVKDASGQLGYLRNDVVELTDAQGGNIAPPSFDEPSSPSTNFGTVTLIKDYVNLRKTPNGASLTLLRKNTTHKLTGEPAVSGKYTWYPITVGSYAGYIREDMVSYISDDKGESDTSLPTASGYVKITLSAVNVRISAAGKTIGRVDKDTIWPLNGNPQEKKGYLWYPIKTDSLKGYVRSDVSRLLTPKETEDYLSGNLGDSSSKPETSIQAYLMSNANNTSLRIAPANNAQIGYTLNKGMGLIATSTVSISGETWYQVSYSNIHTLWVSSKSVNIISSQEYDKWLKEGSSSPDVQILSDMAETSARKVIVRAEGNINSKQLTRIDRAGTVLNLTNKTNSIAGYTWYNVRLASGTIGWIRGDLLRIYTEAEKQSYLDANAPETPPGEKPEASYDLLRKGSTGEAVKRLQAVLKEKGHYNGSISGTYDNATVNAVRAYQRVVKIAVDGIAGPITQHALYDTVPVGSGGSGDFSMNAVEKIDWVTGGIDDLWKRGTNATVKIVGTSYTFKVRRLFGGSHADVEPLTASDTAVLCKYYGVSKASQITESKHYHRVPIWVTLGSRTFAASMYGVPHGEQSIKNNNFPGQFCIHFTNSKTHGSSVVDPGHQSAIQKAYDAAPNKK